MITAIKDYNSMIIKPQFMWIRKHWIAYLALLGITYAVIYLWYDVKASQY